MERALTAKGMATRARIVAGAAELLREHDAAETTLDDIRARTGTSKSQLFHYFPDGKEQLLLAVAEHEADRVLDDQQPHLGDLSTWSAWYQWRDVVVERYRSQGDTCPLGSLFLQIGGRSPGARAIVREMLRKWEASIAGGMRAMQKGGHLSPSFDVGRAAPALLSAVQGGVTIMLSTGDSAHLEAALDWHIGMMRATGSVSG